MHGLAELFHQGNPVDHFNYFTTKGELDQKQKTELSNEI